MTTKINGIVVNTYNGPSAGTIGSCSVPRTQSHTMDIGAISPGDNIVVYWDDTSP